MKKHSLTVQIPIFLIIFVLFIIPPFFVKNSQISYENWNFPWMQIITGTGFLCFYIFYIRDSKAKKDLNTSAAQKLLYNSFTVVFTLALLFFNSLIFKFLATLFPNMSNEVQVTRPDTVLSFIFCFLNFAFSACYEEILYRGYVSDCLISIFKIEEIQDKKRIVFIVVIEISVALLFAFAHIYAGVFSVINAVIAHVILRTIFIKTKNLYTNIIAHCLYNLLILFVF